MEEDLVFGSNIKLPSLPGLQSTCEEELQLLMREVDLTFKKRNQDLLKESKNFQRLCFEQKDEIENLKVSFLNSEQENSRLKKESSLLKQKIEKAERDMIFSNVLKEENQQLKEKLSRLDQQHQVLESSYRELLNALVGLKKENTVQEHNLRNLQLEPTMLKGQIDSEVRKFLSDESELADDLLSDIRQDIDHFKSKLLVGTFEP